ncbi:MAG TPA: hypothetical protein VMT52_11050 [Planctomycetota bacterium]|nr:hypothetical protein [Planctomycetota bacterium]
MDTNCLDTRDLTSAERKVIAAAREKAYILYEGKRVPHRSCGIALAETFNLPTRPYQALRRGGITGEGECGAIKAGELILGEYLGDPDPLGPVTPRLRAAAEAYGRAWKTRVDRGPGGESGSIVCNTLTAPFGDFAGEARQAFCTSIAALVAEVVAEVLLRQGVDLEITPVPGLLEERKEER